MNRPSSGVVLGFNAEPFPVVVCLCGSTKFKDAFLEAAERETLAGKIVLSVGCFAHADAKWDRVSPAAKAKLDTLHLHKIDLADEVLVLNVGGYVGASTKREIWYALLRGKRLRWLEPMQSGEGVIVDGPDLIELIYSWFDDWDHWARAGAEAATR